MGPLLIWPNITIDANVIFGKRLALTRARLIKSYKRVNVKTKMQQIDKVQMYTIHDIPVFG